MLPFRRISLRAFIYTSTIVTFTLYLVASWESPSSWKDTAGMMTSSRSKLAQLLWDRKTANVDEIYGLLHLVTAGSDESQRVLTQNVELDPTKPINLAVYAGGKKTLDWDAEVKRLSKHYPVIVFSKSYCPYSQRAKNLLATYDLHPPPKVIEVDLRDDATVIKALLTRLTHHSTFPNIIIQGKSIGGSDDLLSLHTTKSLTAALERAGVSVRNKATE